MDLRISSEPTAAPADIEAVKDAVNRFNVDVTGVADWWPVTLLLRDEASTVQGGLLGDIWGGWLHVTYLWVAETARGHGHGRRLLQAAEGEARRRGCRYVHLETFSFQARPFYETLGYSVFAELGEYPPGHAHYYLRKTLE